MFVLKQLRRKKNTNQTELAKAIGVSLRTIQLYEKKDANIPIKNLTKIANFFDLTIAELYSYEVNEVAGVYDHVKTETKHGNKISFLRNGKFLVSAPLITEANRAAYMVSSKDDIFLAQTVKVSFVLEALEDCPYMAFEITNNSMYSKGIEGIPNRSIVLGRAVLKEELGQALANDRRSYWILVLKNSIMCKEIASFNVETGNIGCKNLNSSPEFSDFEVNLNDLVHLFVIEKKQIDQ
ncbi:helix-turn-helix domain-containing protein [Spongiimicrobium sp. 3-5]|uniref:helix-turn-helix domain-containing protein n=1 Tax=Spongiimicrobium sp. 3-5 TaxID=3332596 RepID=UPI003980F0DF